MGILMLTLIALVAACLGVHYYCEDSSHQGAEVCNIAAITEMRRRIKQSIIPFIENASKQISQLLSGLKEYWDI